MKRLVVAICGAAALGVAAFSAPASAAPLMPVNPLNGSGISAPVQDVAWRRVCNPTRTWVNGRRVVVTRCKNVWVGGPRGPNRAYYGRPGYGPGPRSGYAPPPPRPGFGIPGGPRVGFY